MPFSYAVDDFSISKTLSGSTTNFNDNFSNGAPPIGGLFGTSVNAFATNGGGGGTTWTESSGHAIMSSSGAAFNGINNSVEAMLLTSGSPEGTGSGQSNQGLKEDATFTVGGTFQLVAPAAGTGYGITLFNAATGVPTTEEVQLLVEFDRVRRRQCRPGPGRPRNRYVYVHRQSGAHGAGALWQYPDCPDPGA